MKKFTLFALCLLLAFLPGVVGGLFTSESVGSEWYEMNQPDFTPPNWLFGPVWTILYFMIGLSLFFVWTNARKKERKKVAYWYGINLVLNGLWSIVFFSLQQAGFAFVILLGIWITIIGMIYVSWKIDRKASWLLVPYLLWVTFAGALNLGFVI